MTGQEHDAIMQIEETASLDKFHALQNQIDVESAELDTINNILFEQQPFGLTLQQMYANSEIIGKNSKDYAIYKDMLQSKELMDMDFNEISEAQKLIKDKKKDDLYYKFLEKKQINRLTILRVTLIFIH